MKIDFSPSCLKRLAEVRRKNQSLFKKITGQLKVFQNNPAHPSLRLHKLSGALEDTWSISINKSIRMIYYYRLVDREKRAVFISIGTHKEVYK